MKKIIVKGVATPIMWMVMFGGLSLLMLWFGFMDISVQGERGPAGVSIQVDRSRLFGLGQETDRLDGVMAVTLEQKKSQRALKEGRNHTIVWTNVVMTGSAGSIGLFPRPTDMDKDLKLEAQAQIENFLADPKAEKFHQKFEVRNALLWGSILFGSLGVLGVFMRPIKKTESERARSD